MVYFFVFNDLSIRGFPKVLVANIDYDDFKGKLGVGRVHSGSIKKGQTVGLGRPEAGVKIGKISELFVFDNLGRTVSIVLKFHCTTGGRCTWLYRNPHIMRLFVEYFSEQ